MLNFLNLEFVFLYCTVPTEDDSETPLANEDIVSQLNSMGFHLIHCQKAAINTSNAGVEEAMNWLLSHMHDPARCIINNSPTFISLSKTARCIINNLRKQNTS
ncbi:hypothetical protein RYX36_030521 [Vicia faba]